MSKILKDPTKDELTETIEKHWYDLLSTFQNGPDVKYEKTTKITELITWLPVYFLNGFYDIHLETSELIEFIEEKMEYYKSVKIPMHWFIGPSTTPPYLGETLEKCGLKKEERAMPGMVVKLDEIKTDLPRPKDLIIEHVEDEETLRTYFETLIIGYGFPESLVEPFSSIQINTKSSEELPMFRYLAYLDGKPVGTSRMAYNAGVAGIFMVATMPEARRKGIGTAMTLDPLLQAREDGYNVGILHASAMGQPVYERMGFKRICDFWFYRWTPEPQE